MAKRFSDLVDLDQFRELMELLHTATGIPLCVMDSQLNPLIKIGWQPICKVFHRANPESESLCLSSNSRLLEGLEQRSFSGSRCENGLYDYAAPILVDGEMVAAVILGQFFHEPPDEAVFLEQAQRFGFDLEAYLDALRQVPVVPLEQVKHILAYLMQLSQMLTTVGLEKRRIQESAASLSQSEESSRQLVETIARQNANLKALNDLTLSLMSHFDLGELLEVILQRATRIIGTSDGFLYLVDPQENTLEMRVGVGVHASRVGVRMGLGEGVAGVVWQTGQPVVIPDYQSWSSRSSQFRGAVIHSVIGVPLIHDSKIIGVLGVSFSERKRILGAEETETLSRLAAQASLALYNTELVQGLEQELYERVRVEAALRLSEEKFSKAFHISPDSININRLSDGMYIEVNEGFTRIVGYTAEDVLGKSSKDIGIWVDLESREELVNGLREKGEVIGLETRFRMKNGDIRVGLMSARVIEVNGEACILSITRDITERRQAEDDLRKSYQVTEMRLKRLSALRNIDLAITSGTELHITIREILGQVRDSLEVDAAVLSVPTPNGTRLMIAAIEGLDGDDILREQVPIDAPYLGRVYQQRESLFLTDLRQIPGESPADRFRKTMVSFAVTPLISKNVVKGILEVYTCQPVEFDSEWRTFFQSLAMQTAIAIDNAELFYRMEMANIELSEAYDKTIEGWARALELRDKETKGHSDRVTRLTLQLARRLGIPEQETPHLRRGVFLHDIGKMGIPDSILNKPGPLNEMEWEIMRQHPGYAYEMLADILYLKPAQNIAYCHHEKWDGSGYPRGLKGESIPLGARIFAVVDVWDALLSDRPYRLAWSEENVRQYLIDQSGRHFDPQIVEAFLQMIDEEESQSENLTPEQGI